MNTKFGLCALLLPVTVAVAASADQHDRADDTRQLRLRGFVGWRWGNSQTTDCGYIPPPCCCVEGQTECRPPVCEAAAANGGKLPCGGQFYTLGEEIVCVGSGGEEADEIPSSSEANDNKGDQDDEETPVKVPPVVLPVEPDAEDTTSSTVTPDDSAKCTIENWNLEGRGEGYSCTSNVDCKYGCCSTGQVKGKCISPFINPSFSDFLGCMPEFSECEANRADEESPYVNNKGELESQYWYGIDKCNPNSNPAAAGITKCCSSSSDCAGFGEECCDRVRLQCVPKLGNPVMIQNFQCLEEGV